MQDFKDWLSEKQNETTVVLWFDPNDLVAKKHAESIIEEGKTYQLDNRYSARLDRSRQPDQKDHTHVYLKGNEVCVVNTDGTPSHGSRPMSSLPGSIQNKMRMLRLVTEQAMLFETAGNINAVLLPRSIITILKLRLLEA